MNKIAFFAASLLILTVQQSPRVTAQDTCEVHEVPPRCQNARRITIHTDEKRIAPPNICVDPGESIPVRVRPRGNSARIEAKEAADWLSGSGESFTIDVPENADGDYDYNVYFEDGTCIDPRIRVR